MKAITRENRILYVICKNIHILAFIKITCPKKAFTIYNIRWSLFVKQFYPCRMKKDSYNDFMCSIWSPSRFGIWYYKSHKTFLDNSSLIFLLLTTHLGAEVPINDRCKFKNSGSQLSSQQIHAPNNLQSF